MKAAHFVLNKYFALYLFASLGVFDMLCVRQQTASLHHCTVVFVFLLAFAISSCFCLVLHLKKYSDTPRICCKSCHLLTFQVLESPVTWRPEPAPVRQCPAYLRPYLNVQLRCVTFVFMWLLRCSTVEHSEQSDPRVADELFTFWTLIQTMLSLRRWKYMRSHISHSLYCTVLIGIAL